MPDTETLEVKEVKEVKMIETEVETESKIEASVGENDVVALVDEAEHLNTSDTSEEMETNTGSDAGGEENQKIFVEKTCENMDIEDSDTAHNVDSRTETNSRISTEPEIKEESSEHIPEETNSNTVKTEVDSAKETDPSIISTDDSNKGDPTTQSVLQKAGETSQLNTEQEEDAQIAKPETEIPLKEKTETPCNQESDPSNNVLKSVVETTITENDLITTSVDYLIPQTTTTTTTISSVEQTGKSVPPPPPGSQGLPMLVKPPKTDDLLQTAREVLQLRDEPAASDVLIGPGGQILTGGAMMEGAQLGGMSLNVLPVSESENILTQDQMEADNAAVQSMEYSDETATYILEPISTNEFVSNDDPNIMWIQETVEVEQESADLGQNMIIILNPNGTINEELMLAHGVNQEAIKAVSEGGLIGLTDPNAPVSIKSLQHPIPQKDLTNVKPLMTTSQIPRTLMETVLPDSKTSVTLAPEHSRSVILDPKDNFLVLDDLERDPMIEPLDLPVSQPTHRIININGTNHIITTTPRLSRPLNINKPEVQFSVSSLSNAQLPMTPLGTLDLSLPKKPDPSVLEQFVNPGALVSESSVLKALSKPDSGNILTKDHLTGKIIRTTGQKVRRAKARDENGNGTPYIHRKTTSLGALGQALHGPLMGIPRDSRENAVQICPICKFQATTKNPYRHLQDHLARYHFKERIAADLPTKKPYICPMPGCDNKHYPDWQAVMRHYIGKKHGILDKFVKEELAQIRKENGGKIPGAVITPTIEVQL